MSRTDRVQEKGMQRRSPWGVRERIHQTHPQRVAGWVLTATGEGVVLGIGLDAHRSWWPERAGFALVGVAFAVLLYRLLIHPRVEVWSGGVAVVQPFRTRFAAWDEIHTVRAVERLEVLCLDGRVLHSDGVVALRAFSSGELYADRVAAELNRRLGQRRGLPTAADRRLEVSPAQRRELQRSAWVGLLTSAALLVGLLAIQELVR